MRKKFLKLVAPAIGLIMVVALASFMAGGARAATTPEEAFATYLKVVDAGLLSGSRDTSVGFGAWAARHGDTYKSVTSVPTTRSVSVIGTRATIVEDVATTLLWSSTATSKVTLDPRKALDVQKAKKVGRAFGPGDIVTSIVSAQHTVTLVLVNGSWVVVNDAYVDPFTDTVTVP